jgi:peptidoglycan/LPS O-acetylase OafA/YrhL
VSNQRQAAEHGSQGGAESSREQFPALTGIRAIAAYLVFLHHYVSSAIAHELYIGVSIFFVLSGYLIAYKYAGSAQLSWTWLRGFWWNRFARIYPLYGLLAAATLLVLREQSVWSWVVNLTVLGSPIEMYQFVHRVALDESMAGLRFTSMPQCWSLFVELCFYGTAPVLFVAARKSLLYPLAGMAAVLSVAMLGLQFLSGTPGLVGAARYLALYTLPGRFFEFFVGICLARWHVVWGASEEARRGLPIRTVGGLAGIVAATLGLYGLEGPEYLFGQYHPVGIAINSILLPPAIGVLFYGLIRERSWLRWCLATPCMRFLGNVSYAFYLVHMGPVGGALLRATGDACQTLGGVEFGTAAQYHLAQPWGAFVALNGAAILLYLLIELPAHHWLRRPAGGGTQAPAPAPPPVRTSRPTYLTMSGDRNAA